MALFVSIEGSEGAGKTAISRRLAARMAAFPVEVVETFEPGATPLGAELRRRLFAAGPDDTPLAPWTETFLLLADRAHHVTDVLRPALARGAVVLCDRYTDSTIAYQGYGRRLDIETLHAMNRRATDGLMPNLTLFLDLPAAAGLARSRPEASDRIGRETVDFHGRVLEGYRRIALAEPDRVQTIDAAAPLDDVVEAIWALLEPRLRRQGYRTAG